jgi:hypothetical protein
MKSIVTKQNKLSLGYNANGKYGIQIENYTIQIENYKIQIENIEYK